MLLFRSRTILMTRARSRFEKVHRLSLCFRVAAQIAQKRNCDARMSYATNCQAERSKCVPPVTNHVLWSCDKRFALIPKQTVSCELQQNVLFNDSRDFYYGSINRQKNLVIEQWEKIALILINIFTKIRFI